MHSHIGALFEPFLDFIAPRPGANNVHLRKCLNFEWFNLEKGPFCEFQFNFGIVSPYCSKQLWKIGRPYFSCHWIGFWENNP